MAKQKISREEIAKELAIVRREGWLEILDALSLKYSIDASILLGMASRETNCKPDYAYCRKLGDGGNGHGIVQIDKRYHSEFLKKHNFKPQPLECLDYGAALLKTNLDHFKGDLLKALCAYNAGIGGVKRVLKAGKTPDQATTGGDYGSDVLYRAELFKDLLATGN